MLRQVTNCFVNQVVFLEAVQVEIVLRLSCVVYVNLVASMFVLPRPFRLWLIPSIALGMPMFCARDH